MSGKDEVRAKEIGARVKRLRLKNNMTQRELSETVNVSSSCISRLESGEQMVGVFMIMDIAEALHTSVGNLLEEDVTEGHVGVNGLNGVIKQIEQIEEHRRMDVINAIECLLDARA